MLSLWVTHFKIRCVFARVSPEITIHSNICVHITRVVQPPFWWIPPLAHGLVRSARVGIVTLFPSIRRGTPEERYQRYPRPVCVNCPDIWKRVWIPRFARRDRPPRSSVTAPNLYCSSHLYRVSRNAQDDVPKNGLNFWNRILSGEPSWSFEKIATFTALLSVASV